MPYDDILTCNERMKEVLESLQHMDYKDICTSMIHHSTEEDPFIGLEEEAINNVHYVNLRISPKLFGLMNIIIAFDY